MFGAISRFRVVKSIGEMRQSFSFDTKLKKKAQGRIATSPLIFFFFFFPLFGLQHGSGHHAQLKSGRWKLQNHSRSKIIIIIDAYCGFLRKALTCRYARFDSSLGFGSSFFFFVFHCSEISLLAPGGIFQLFAWRSRETPAFGAKTSKSCWSDLGKGKVDGERRGGGPEAPGGTRGDFSLLMRANWGRPWATSLSLGSPLGLVQFRAWRKTARAFPRPMQLPSSPSVTYWSKILTPHGHITVDCNPTGNWTCLPLSTCLFFGVTYEIIILLILLNIIFLKLRNWQG